MSACADSRVSQVSPTAALALADKLHRIFDILRETSATSVAICPLRDGGVTCRTIAGLPITEIGDPINRKTGLTGLTIRRQISQWHSDTESDARVNKEPCRRLGLRSIIVVPVSVKDDVVGVFAIFSGNPDDCSLADPNTTKQLSHWVSAAAETATVKTLPATIAPASVDQELSDEQFPIIFNSEYTQENWLRNYAGRIWRAMTGMLPGRQRERAS